MQQDASELSAEQKLFWVLCSFYFQTMMSAVSIIFLGYLFERCVVLLVNKARNLVKFY